MAGRFSVFLALLLLTCIATVTGQGPVILKQIPDQPANIPLNEIINLRTDFSHPDPDENLILTVQQAGGSPLPDGVTLTMKAPTFVGSYNTPGEAVGITVVGSLAYVADRAPGLLQILDVSTPSAPTLLGSYNTPDYAVDVTVVGSLAYVAARGSGLQMLDVSAPSAPTFVGSYNTPGEARGVTVVGTLAYVADDTSGLKIIDVSIPSAPTLLGSYNTPGLAFGVTVVGSLAYVADDAVGGLQIIDVSTPSAPTLVGSYNTPGAAFDVTVVGTLAYVADTLSGLQILDVSAPSAPTFVGSYNTPGEARSITVVGSLAYLADRNSGLQIIDVSTPSAPTFVGSYNTPGDAWGLAVVGTLAYVADSAVGGLQIIDVSQWQLLGSPSVQASYTLAVNVEDSQGLSAVYNFAILVASSSPSQSMSFSQTATESRTQSSTESASPSASPSASQSMSFSQTATESHTQSSTESRSPSASSSASQSMSFSQTVTTSLTQSLAETASLTASPTSSPTATPQVPPPFTPGDTIYADGVVLSMMLFPFDAHRVIVSTPNSNTQYLWALDGSDQSEIEGNFISSSPVHHWHLGAERDGQYELLASLSFDEITISQALIYTLDAGGAVALKQTLSDSATAMAYARHGTTDYIALSGGLTAPSTLYRRRSQDNQYLFYQTVEAARFAVDVHAFEIEGEPVFAFAVFQTATGSVRASSPILKLGAGGWEVWRTLDGNGARHITSWQHKQSKKEQTYLLVAESTDSFGHEVYCSIYAYSNGGFVLVQRDLLGRDARHWLIFSFQNIAYAVLSNHDGRADVYTWQKVKDGLRIDASEIIQSIPTRKALRAHGFLLDDIQHLAFIQEGRDTLVTWLATKDSLPKDKRSGWEITNWQIILFILGALSSIVSMAYTYWRYRVRKRKELLRQGGLLTEEDVADNDSESGLTTWLSGYWQFLTRKCAGWCPSLSQRGRQCMTTCSCCTGRGSSTSGRNYRNLETM